MSNPDLLEESLDGTEMSGVTHLIHALDELDAHYYFCATTRNYDGKTCMSIHGNGTARGRPGRGLEEGRKRGGE